jgi:hypothetical protein
VKVGARRRTAAFPAASQRSSTNSVALSTGAPQRHSRFARQSQPNDGDDKTSGLAWRTVIIRDLRALSVQTVSRE